MRVIDHKDGDPTNNDPTNLRIVTMNRRRPFHSPDLAEDLANGYPPAVAMWQRSVDAMPDLDQLPTTEPKPSELGKIVKVRGELFAFLGSAIGWVRY